MPATPLAHPERALVGAAIVLTGVVFAPSAADPVNVPKLTCLLLAALGALTAVLIRAVRTRTLTLPTGLPALAGGLLAAAFVTAAVVAPRTTPAILGVDGRNSGLLAYGAALVLFFVTLVAFTPRATAVIAVALIVSALVTAGYGLLQRLGIDPISWSNPFNPIIASLGNPDFASGYLGIAMPVCLWGACWTGWHRALRIASGATGLLCLLVALLSHAVQGPLAAAAGAAVVALAVALDLAGRRRRAGVGALAGLVALALALVALGFAGIGPARSFFSGVSFDARACYWRAGVTMWQRSPVTGVGLDSYGQFWRRDEPLYCPGLLGPGAYTDAAHSVPLQHLAQGGLVLTAAYLLFTGVVIAAAVLGLRRLAGQDRLLLAGLAGSWVAYRVQSAVSIDQVPLLLLDYVLGAAVIVAAGRARLRQVRLPGALRETTQPGRGRGKRQPVVTSRRLTWVDAALLTALAAVAVTLAWMSLTPLRASRAALRGDEALSRGDGTAAVAAYERAIALEPGVGSYRTRLGQLYAQVQRDAQAVPILDQAFRLDPSQVEAERTAASLAEGGGNVRLARRLFGAALAADPKNSKTIQQYAAFERRHGGNAVAARRLEQAVKDLPHDADLWAVLGVARLELGDRTGARAAWTRALAIQPDQPTALEELKATAAAGG